MNIKQVLDYALWFMPLLLQAVIVWRMRQIRLDRSFPHFFRYNMFVVLTGIAMILIYHFLRDIYFYAYWAAAAVSAGLAFAVIMEIFVESFRPYEALRDFGRILFRWCFALMIGIAAIFVLATPGNGSHAAIDFILSFERGVRIAQCGLLLLFYLFATQLGFSHRSHLWGIVSGYGLFAALDLILNSLQTRFGAGFGATYSILHAGAYTLAIGIWSFYLLRPEPQRADARGFGLILGRWNRELSELRITKGRKPVDSFLPNLETTVARVMATEHAVNKAG